MAKTCVVLIGRADDRCPRANGIRGGASVRARCVEGRKGDEQPTPFSLGSNLDTRPSTLPRTWERPTTRAPRGGGRGGWGVECFDFGPSRQPRRTVRRRDLKGVQHGAHECVVADESGQGDDAAITQPRMQRREGAIRDPVRTE